MESPPPCATLEDPHPPLSPIPCGETTGTSTPSPRSERSGSGWWRPQGPAVELHTVPTARRLEAVPRYTEHDGDDDCSDNGHGGIDDASHDDGEEDEEERVEEGKDSMFTTVSAASCSAFTAFSAPAHAHAHAAHVPAHAGPRCLERINNERTYRYKLYRAHWQLLQQELFEMKEKTDEMKGRDMRMRQRFHELQQRRHLLATDRQVPAAAAGCDPVAVCVERPVSVVLTSSASGATESERTVVASPPSPPQPGGCPWKRAVGCSNKSSRRMPKSPRIPRSPRIVRRQPAKACTASPCRGRTPMSLPQRLGPPSTWQDTTTNAATTTTGPPSSTSLRCDVITGGMTSSSPLLTVASHRRVGTALGSQRSASIGSPRRGEGTTCNTHLQTMSPQCSAMSPQRSLSAMSPRNMRCSTPAKGLAQLTLKLQSGKKTRAPKRPTPTPSPLPTRSSPPSATDLDRDGDGDGDLDLEHHDDQALTPRPSAAVRSLYSPPLVRGPRGAWSSPPSGSCSAGGTLTLAAGGPHSLTAWSNFDVSSSSSLNESNCTASGGGREAGDRRRRGRRKSRSGNKIAPLAICGDGSPVAH